MEILITALGCLILFLIQLRIYRKMCFKKLSYRCYFSKDEAYEGEEIEFIEEIENIKRLPLPVFKTELTASAALFFADTHSAVTDCSRFITSYFEVGGKCRVRRVWKLRCEKRGVHGITSVVMVSTDIFGTESYSCRPETKLPEITILPRQYSFETSRLFCRSICGDMPINNPPFSDPFYSDGLREYTGAEPLKFINHNASAHENRLMVNTFEASAERNANVILTFGRSEAANEHSIRVCAYLMTVLSRNHIISGLTIAGDKSRETRCENALQYLRALADVVPSPTEKLPESLTDKTIIITDSKRLAERADCAVIFTGSMTPPEKPNVICVSERRAQNEKS